jgi:hypothetical protein
LANASTSKVNDVALALEVTAIVAALVLEDVALRAVHAEEVDMAVAASVNAENSDCNRAKPDIWLLSTLALLCKLVRGCRSKAVSLETIELTSRPLEPMPKEVMVGIVFP